MSNKGTQLLTKHIVTSSDRPLMPTGDSGFFYI